MTLLLCNALSGQSLGDVNYDGSITIVDALFVAQYYVGKTPSPFYSSAADVNCSGSITIVDALQIAQYYVRIITSFACATPVPGEGTVAMTLVSSGTINPGTNIHLLTIHWTAVNYSSSYIQTNINALYDPSGLMIGSSWMSISLPVPVSQIITPEPTADPTPDPTVVPTDGPTSDVTDGPTPVPTSYVSPAPSLDPAIKTLKCRLNFSTVDGTADHWVPNTNEDSRPFTIDIFGENSEGNTVYIPDGTNIQLLGPEDPNYETIDTDNANIHRNRGTVFYLKPYGQTDVNRLDQPISATSIRDKLE